LKLFFTEQDFLKALEDSKFGATHEAGRFVDLENKKEGLKVRVRNNDKRDVHEITVWKKDLIDL
jgi:hypothetical protein